MITATVTFMFVGKSDHTCPDIHVFTISTSANGCAAHAAQAQTDGKQSLGMPCGVRSNTNFNRALI